MESAETRDIGRLSAPFSKEIVLQTLLYDNGFPMMRLRIRERTRFTMLDLDPATAQALKQAIEDWLLTPQAQAVLAASHPNEIS